MTTKYIPSNTSRNENQLIQPKTEVVENEIKNTNATGNTGNTGWDTPKPLEVDHLPKPKELRKEMLPKAFRQFIIEKSYSVDDTAPDYLAVALVVMSATIIGSNAEIKPKKRDSWSIGCTLWSFLIGRASDKKTPALSAALSAVEKVKKSIIAPKVAALEKSYQLKMKSFLKVKAKLDKQYEAAFEEDNDDLMSEIEAKILALKEPESFDKKEIYVNDSTIEALTLCAESSPSGLAVVRDEASGLLAIFEQASRTHERSIYLEGYNAKRVSYTIRRIGRDNVVLPQLFINILGGIQPDMLRGMIQSALCGKMNDGFLERILQMSVYPESKKRTLTDVKVSPEAEQSIIHVYSVLAHLDTPHEPFEFKFDHVAQAKWTKWSEEALRDEQNSSKELLSYHAKRTEHCAKLALIFHLIDEASKSPIDSLFNPKLKVGVESLSRAMVWMRYLRSHAYRIIESGKCVSSEQSPASVLLEHLSDLGGQFTKSQLSTKGWKNFKTSEQRNEAVEVLLRHGYIKEARIFVDSSTKDAKGYIIHPDFAQK
ncbi:DUF3987 domain-containing protein [Vibrio sp. Vb2880]|uniref:DUF3987 domain-containing protein n=1 Tax=Vibrio sp. Vb2880 TaxID=2816076 RepID=UPI001A8ED606|nr:DUF3987 domain-containing protein [Vibrio sp. Vb2880]MBO0215792.1 DUF3987 domain-containing protein [Vibrio sp. Vb2880]